MTDTVTRAAIWARVSTGRQETRNQLDQLQAFATRRGLQVDPEAVYTVEESAWTGKHRSALAAVIRDAHAGRFQVLLVWALDRLSREGPLATLQTVDRLSRHGVQVLSYQEPWTEAAGEMRELMLAIVGWVARSESNRRSERVRAGMERARAENKHVGRPPRTRPVETLPRFAEVCALVLAGSLNKTEAARKLHVRKAAFVTAYAREARS